MTAQERQRYEQMEASTLAFIVAGETNPGNVDEEVEWLLRTHSKKQLMELIEYSEWEKEQAREARTRRWQIAAAIAYTAMPLLAIIALCIAGATPDGEGWYYADISWQNLIIAALTCALVMPRLWKFANGNEK